MHMTATTVAQLCLLLIAFHIHQVLCKQLYLFPQSTTLNHLQLRRMLGGWLALCSLPTLEGTQGNFTRSIISVE